MKIGIDIRPLLQSNYSGVSEYTFRILSSMFNITQDNNYTLFYNSHKNLAANIPHFNYKNLKIKETRWPNKLFNFSQAFFDYPQLDRIISQPDILFFPNFNFASISKRTPHVFTVHDLSFERFPRYFDAKHRLWHSLIQPKRLSQEATHLIAVSNSTKFDLMDIYNIDEKKISVIPEGVAPIFFDEVQENSLIDVKNKFSLPENFILFIGTVEPRKNIISIIESMKYLPDEISLVVAGKRGWKSNDIYKVAEKFTGRVKFLNYITQEEKRALIKLAKVFVWPSYYEGFGLPLLEAQAGGLPVITSPNSSLTEVVGNSAIYTDPDDIRNIAKNINDILNDSELYSMIKERGVENAKKFSWDSAANKTLALFKDIVK